MAPPLGAVALVLFGIFKLVRPRSHPRWVGLRDLALWSFFMSSAHGAGLMLVPILLGLPSASEVFALPGLSFSTAMVVQDTGAVLIHTLAMLLVMGIVAVVVYEWVGVGVLRRAWLNADLLWAIALVAAGVVTLFS